MDTTKLAMLTSLIVSQWHYWVSNNPYHLEFLYILLILYHYHVPMTERIRQSTFQTHVKMLETIHCLLVIWVWQNLG